MLFEGTRNSNGRRQCFSKYLGALAIDSRLYEGGRELTIVISAAKIGQGWKIPDTVWVLQGLLADIILSCKKS